MSGDLHCTQNMPPGLAEVFRPLWEDTANLYYEFEVYRLLYGSDPGTVALMNQSAPGFFRTVQDCLLHSIILGVCRLTDPVGNADKTNLVLAGLLDHIDDARPGLRVSVDQMLATLKKNTDPLRAHRRKRIAHTDRVVRQAPAGQVLPALTVADLRTALKGIGGLLNAVQSAYNGDVTTFEGLDAEDDVGRIVRVMEQSKAYRSIQRPR
jgi:hypothetical protein